MKEAKNDGRPSPPAARRSAPACPGGFRASANSRRPLLRPAPTGTRVPGVAWWRSWPRRMPVAAPSRTNPGSWEGASPAILHPAERATSEYEVSTRFRNRRSSSPGRDDGFGSTVRGPIGPAVRSNRRGSGIPGLGSRCAVQETSRRSKKAPGPSGAAWHRRAAEQPSRLGSSGVNPSPWPLSGR